MKPTDCARSVSLASLGVPKYRYPHRRREHKLKIKMLRRIDSAPQETTAIPKRFHISLEMIDDICVLELSHLHRIEDRYSVASWGTSAVTSSFNHLQA